KVEEDPEVPESPEPLEPSPDPARPRPRKPKVRASVPRLDEDDGVGVARVEVKVQSGRSSTGTRLTLRICAMLDGDSLEDEPPTGASVPQPLYWSAPGGERIPTTGEHLDVGIDQDGLWVLTVRLVEDAAVQVQVTAEPIP
ncbi:MAG TPA: hypothetical protein PLA94_25230, partial [Myxococcota bacterium]|nr:hypothetical protein [Myxococcota bacterium]